MNRIIASTVALLTVVGAAYAAEVEGTVQEVDPVARIIVLDNGLTLSVSEDLAIEQIPAGAKVKVTYEEDSATVTAIEAVM